MRRKYITKEEFDILLNSRVKTKRESGKRVLRYRTILSLLYYHGLRKKELCDLKWENVNLSCNPPNIFIERAKNGRSGTHPLVSDERTLLESLKKMSVKDEYVIENPMGGKLSRESIDKFFQTINEKEILPFHLHPHMLRHGCGYYLANKDVSLRRIQDYLGHTNLSSTVIYTTLSSKKFVGLWD